MTLFGSVGEVLRQASAFALRRHELLAQNVANADTPGFRARELTFDHALSIAQRVRALPAPAAGAPDLDLRLVDGPDEPGRADGNNVDIDRQMARLAQNTAYQHTVIQLLNGKFRALKTAINGAP